MEIVLFAGLGLIVGSFLNVVIFREGTDEGLGGRSHCVHCKKTLAPMDLVPVFSWILLGGRCRYCKERISLQYPLVELFTAVLFVLVGASQLAIPQQILGLCIVSLCIAITVYDMRFMLIPDAWNYGFSFAALAYGALSLQSLSELPLLLCAGPFVSFPLWALWAVSGGRWMGLGDVKFALGIGWLLGAYFGYIALLGAFVIGALVSVAILLPLPYYLRIVKKLSGFTPTPIVALLLSVFRNSEHKEDTHHEGLSRSSTPLQQKTMPQLVWGFTMTSEVPFGPFLISSCLIVWFCIMYGVALPPLW